MADRKIATAGVNAFKCACGDGTVLVPVSMAMIARMRCGERITVKGKCHIGHTQEYDLVTWPPFPEVLDRV